MKKKKFKDRALIQKRLTLVVWTIVVVFFILILRLSYIMIVKRDEYSSRAEEQWTSEVSIDARRGRILDRNGVELAVSANVYRVDFDLNSVRQYLKNNSLTNADIAGKIADAVGMEENKVMEKLETKLASGANAGSATLIRRIEKESADKVNNLNIDGVIVSPDTKRYYPKGEFLAHVLGSTNVDGQGLTGVELQYNEYLSGVPGVRISEIERNEENLSYTISNFTEPIDGKDVTLTTDSKIQAIAEKVAEKGLVDNQAKRVSIMVMNPNNGELYAMVNVPEYNLNEPYVLNYEVEDDGSSGNKMDLLNNMWRNFCINDTYEPGSVFKMVTATAALETKVVSLSDSYTCSGSTLVGDRRIRCHKTTGHGTQDFTHTVMNSCNPAFIEWGRRVGVDNFYNYCGKLGLLSKTGIDIAGEASTIIHNKENVGEVELATMSFGQSFQITPIQMLRAAAAIVNGGNLVTPHFAVKTSDGSGQTYNEFYYSTTESTIDKSTSDTMRDILRQVVEEGGGKNAYIEGFSIGGKTATSQKLPRGSGKYIASFIGFSSVENPQVIAMCLIDEPEGVYYGGTIAAPVIRELYENILPYLNNK